MKANCGKIHSVNFQETCCFKNLIEMSEIAENQMKMEIYSRMLINALKLSENKDKTQIDKFSNCFSLKFLEILSKYINYFYFSEQYTNVMTLISFGMKIIKNKSHDDSINFKRMKFSFLINLSCIYSKKADYYAALKCLRLCSKLFTSSVDQAIYYNNVSRIFADKGDYQSSSQYMKLSIVNFEKDLFQEKKDKYYGELSSSLTRKCQLLSFLYLNQGIILHNSNNIKESQEIFKLGLKFSLQNLGEFHPFISKFKIRLTIKEIDNIQLQISYSKTPKKYTDKRNEKTLIDISINYNHLGVSPSDLHNKNKRSSSHMRYSFNNVDRIKNSDIQQINYKLNLIIEKFGGIPNNNLNNNNNLKRSLISKSKDNHPNIKHNSKQLDNNKSPDVNTENNLLKKKSSNSNVHLPSINLTKETTKSNKFDLSSLAQNDSSPLNKTPINQSLKNTKINEQEQKYIDDLRIEFEREERINQTKKNLNNKLVNLSNNNNDFLNKTTSSPKQIKKSLELSNESLIKPFKENTVDDQKKKTAKTIFTSSLLKRDIKKVEMERPMKKDRYTELMMKIDMDLESNEIKIINDQKNDESLFNYSIDISDENEPEEISDDKRGILITKSNISLIHNNSINIEDKKDNLNIPYIINVLDDDGIKNYSFQPYYCSSSSQSNDSSKMITIQKNEKLSKNYNFIIESIEYKKYVEDNSYLLKKTCISENINGMLDILFKIKEEKIISKICIIRNIQYKIVFHFLNNTKIFLLIKAYNQTDSNSFHEKRISKRKFQDIFHKIQICEMLPLNFCYIYINTYEILVNIILSHTTYLNKQTKGSNAMEIKLSPNPIGVLFLRKYNFEFMDCKNATVDIIVIKRMFLRMFIINDVVKRSHNLPIDIFLDENSFDNLFSEIDNSNFKNNSKEEKNYKSYLLSNKEFEEKILQKTLKRIGEIIKIRNKNNMTFENICENASTIFKLKITRNLQNIEFWIQSFDETKFIWTTDYYTFHKILVKKSYQYFTKSLDLEKEDFKQIFGYGPQELWHKMTKKQKIISNYIMMNSIKLGQILKEIQTDKNNEIILNLIRINPYSLYSYKFVYYKDKIIWTVAFEFLFYNRINYFIRIQLSDNFTFNTITHILLGLYENIINETNMQFFYVDFTTFKSEKKEIEKFLESNGIFLNDHKLLKKSLIEYIEEYFFKKDNFKMNLFSNYENLFKFLKQNK